MTDEIARIRRMVEEGKVTPEEGRALIDSIPEALKPPPPPPAMPMPEPAPPEMRVSWILWPLLTHGLCFLAIFLVMTVWVPKFQEIFRSFALSLPMITRVVIGACTVAQKWAILILPAAAGALALDVVLYAHLRRRGSRTLARLWWWAVSLLLIAGMLAIVLGLALAQIQLMTQVSNSASGG